MRKLRQAFAAEAVERLSAMETALVGLESQAGQNALSADLLEDFYRDVHSLKGASRTVGAMAVEAVCQPMESVLGALKAVRLTPSPALFDLLHKALKTLRSLLARFDPEQGGRSLPPPDDPTLARLAAALSAAAEGRETPADVSSSLHDGARQPGAPAPETGPDQDDRSCPSPRTARSHELLRLPSERLERLMRDCEEFLPEKQAMAELLEGAKRIQNDLLLLRRHMGQMATELTKAVTGLTGKSGQDLLPLLDRCENLSAGLGAEVKSHAARLNARQRSLTGKVDDLLGDLKQALTLPISHLFERFPMVARDLSQELGKSAELVLEGEDMEVDRRILDQLHDPLLHLVRNALDHGLEPPDERGRRGKPGRGRITLRASALEQDRMEIVVADDGRGIDHEAVLEAARAAGLTDGAEAAGLSRDAALDLVFRSGMSTSKAVTELSGRGLGLAIVRERVERLGGTMRLETRPGQGTAFHLFLPLSFSSFPALAVLAGERTFLLAKSRIERMLLLDPEDILRLEGRDAVNYQGSPLPMLDLADILELPESTEDHEEERGQGRLMHVIVAASGGRRVALRVDALLGEREIMVKSLGNQLRRVRNVAGVTVLSDGSLAPILHVPDLVAGGLGDASRRPARGPAAAKPPEVRTVLVAEDSITSRMLLKGILESAGYAVVTAVDGVEALARLREARPDLVVSDVQMPRMDGLELTRSIRGDKSLSALPVVLVTSLDSPGDRERGVDAGANAYIVKSSFDHGDLLQTVRRLI